MFLLILTLLYNSVTTEQWGTGADTSSDSQPQKTRPVQTWSSQSPASSTAPASPTSTESQVGRFDSETNLWICCYVYVYVLYVYVCVADWSTCQLSENAICGQGSRLRLLDCIRRDGKVVELQKCEQVITVTSDLKFITACRILKFAL